MAWKGLKAGHRRMAGPPRAAGIKTENGLEGIESLLKDFRERGPVRIKTENGLEGIESSHLDEVWYSNSAG
jgi:hypothetical protein